MYEALLLRLQDGVPQMQKLCIADWLRGTNPMDFMVQ